MKRGHIEAATARSHSFASASASASAPAFGFRFGFGSRTLCDAAKGGRKSRVPRTRAARGIAPIRSSGQDGLSIEYVRP
jgi:hypothetical protein